MDRGKAGAGRGAGGVPSFAAFAPSSEASSQAKRATRRRDTSPELALRRELWRAGLRYRKNVRTLPGKPDTVFRRARVVVFCDGDFWHGREWCELRVKLQRRANPDYWIPKIATNMARDGQTDEALKGQGRLVVRLWETDILADPSGCADRVRRLVAARVQPAAQRAEHHALR